MRKYWELREDEELRKLVHTYNFREIGDQLGRSADSVRNRWNRIKNQVVYENVLNSNVQGDVPELTFKTAVFDIETMDLWSAGGYGNHLVCASLVDTATGEVSTLSLNFSDNRNDRRLLSSLLDKLSEFQVLIGHNIAAFDLNFIWSRAMWHKMNMPKTWQYYDTYQHAKSMAIKSRKSLGDLCSFFGIDSGKTKIFEPDWHGIESDVKAEFDDAMEQIVEHCEADVIANWRLASYIYFYDHKKQLKETKW